MDTVRLEALDEKGRNRIATALRRLKRWDGVSWSVTPMPVPEACIGRMHVRPATDESVDWLGFWVQGTGDPHFAVAPAIATAQALLKEDDRRSASMKT